VKDTFNSVHFLLAVGKKSNNFGWDSTISVSRVFTFLSRRDQMSGLLCEDNLSSLSHEDSNSLTYS
jgi:hypothetical protein